jgi:hypothetical protein
MRTPLLLPLTTFLLGLATVLPAQQGGVTEAPTEVVDERRQKGEGNSKGERREMGEKGEEREEERLTPEERLARNITSGASAHCRFVASLRPAKLLPGQSGTLLVTAVLMGDAVLPSPPPLELMSSTSQGVVSLGGLMVRPADNGRLAKGYLGRPVYDNYAVFEVPVTLAADAQIGKKYPISVDMKFDLYDGSSAQAIGRFLDRVVHEVEVGTVPDPAVRGAARAPQGTPSPAEPVVVAKAPPAEPAASAVRPAGVVVSDRQPEVAPPVVAPPVSPATGTDLLSDDGGSADYLLLTVGGGILLVLVVLLLARRK